MAGKGSKFERDMARAFSMWFSEGKSDELFWRVMGSGGRATRRSRTGKAVKNQSFGDLEATSPESKVFTDAVVVELKRGYGRWSFEDVIDNKVASTQPWAKFCQQTLESWRDSGRRFWMVVYKRDQRHNMVALQPEFFIWLYGTALKDAPARKMEMTEAPKLFLKNAGDYSCAVMRLEDFFAAVHPEVFKELL